MRTFLRRLALDQYLQAFELAVGLVRVQEGELDHSTQQAEAFGPMCLRLQENSRATLLGQEFRGQVEREAEVGVGAGSMEFRTHRFRDRRPRRAGPPADGVGGADVISTPADLEHPRVACLPLRDTVKVRVDIPNEAGSGADLDRLLNRSHRWF